MSLPPIAVLAPEAVPILANLVSYGDPRAQTAVAKVLREITSANQSAK